jgi:hypothetical protein
MLRSSILQRTRHQPHLTYNPYDTFVGADLVSALLRPEYLPSPLAHQSFPTIHYQIGVWSSLPPLTITARFPSAALLAETPPTPPPAA